MFQRIARLSSKFKRAKHYNKIENVINLDVAIVQAATMLDEAGTRAIKKHDTEGMLAVSAGWMELGIRLLGGGSDEESEDDEEETELVSETKIMGFQSGEVREVMERENEGDKSKARL